MKPTIGPNLVVGILGLMVFGLQFIGNDLNFSAVHISGYYCLLLGLLNLAVVDWR